ncbi:MAG: SusD/RagB family nutrient-binding outer membrane lipoprotein [Bacteroidota bacterium]
MKTIQSYVLILLTMISLSSCESYFGDININPDDPITVTPNVLLPQIQVRLAYTVWGDGSRYVGIYTQHIDGISRQFATIQNYDLQPNNLDAMWDNLYSGVLMDNRQLQIAAEANGYTHYLGVSKAVEAYALLFITDIFGDAPYSESFQGTEIIQPKFDSQETLFTTIFALIDESRGLLNQEDASGVTPGADDLLYGGDLAKWEAFLSVLEARAKLHLSKRDATNYQDALDALADGFTSAEGDARLTFGSTATASAPWYQYIEQRDDIEIGDSYVALMEGLNDPRKDAYGVLLDVPAHPIFIRERAVPLLSYTEQKFIEAEALFETSGAAAAQDAYLAAIEASFAEAGVEGYADYVAQESVVPANGITLEHIITQKYIALFADPEVFSDWRRTGIPELDPNTGSTVPRRLPYAQKEILSNENTPSPADVTVFTRIWWDVQ